MAEKSRAKKTLLNIIASMGGILVTSVLGLYVSFLVLNTYGPDYYGLNTTLLQVLAVLQIIEAGFSLAVNVALYKPTIDNDQERINAIFYLAKKTFRKIGTTFVVISILSSFIIPLFINTSISYFEVVILFMFAALPVGANIFFAMKITCICSANQKEYIPQFINICMQILANTISIAIIYLGLKYIYFRGVIFIIGFLFIPALAVTFKKKFPKIKPQRIENMPVIKGIKDVAVSRVASTLYLSLPVILIAVFIDTVAAGVFGVYMVVINLIKTTLNAVLSAPTNGFGQLISEGNKEHLYKQFYKFNLVAAIMANLLLSVTLTLIIPFVLLYTKNIIDVNYKDPLIAIMLVAVAFIGVLHNPSGIILYAGGHFRAGRNICFITATAITVLGIIGIILFSLHGLLWAMLICTVLLACCEVIFIHKKMFPGKLLKFFTIVLTNVPVFVGLCLTWHFAGIGQYINSIPTFIFWGGVVFAANAIIILLTNYIIFKNEMRDLIMQFLRVIMPSRNKKRSREVASGGEVEHNEP